MNHSRIIKACSKCNYELTEQVNHDNSQYVVGDCACPQCGGKAKHFMFIDKRNLPDTPDVNEGIPVTYDWVETPVED